MTSNLASILPLNTIKLRLCHTVWADLGVSKVWWGVNHLSGACLEPSANRLVPVWNLSGIRPRAVCLEFLLELCLESVLNSCGICSVCKSSGIRLASV